MLRQTLEAMALVDLDGLAVQFVVVDNNSTDETPRVLESFASRLPLIPLFEPRSGKNFALNHALDSAELGDIVVFTDDDIVPRRDWLQQVAAASTRWPDYAVFGGKIEPLWPEGIGVPEWALRNDAISSTMFAVQNLGDEDRAYAVNELPFGPNMWVRKCVFEGGRRFDGNIGPRPGSYKMGSETSFLLQLRHDGYDAVYAHGACVGHHVQARLLTEDGLVARFIRSGRGNVPRLGVNRKELLARSAPLWYMRTLLAIANSSVRLAIARVFVPRSQRVERMAFVAKVLGHDLESLREVRLHGRDGVV